MIPHLIARLCLLLHLARSARDGHGLDEPTREYDPIDLAGLRASREIHGRTAPELGEDRRREEHVWSRIEVELIGDADFRRIAASLLDQFPT